jgi:hypothetical protein
LINKTFAAGACPSEIEGRLCVEKNKEIINPADLCDLCVLGGLSVAHLAAANGRAEPLWLKFKYCKNVCEIA